MQIDIKNMSLESKLTILALLVVSLLLIGLSIIANEILGVLCGVTFWIIIIDIFIAESQSQTISMFNLLCDVQQEMLAEKYGCSRAEVDVMCTERLKRRNEKSR